MHALLFLHEPSYLSTEPLFKTLGHDLLLTLGSCASGLYPLSMTKMLLIFCDYNIILRIISILIALHRHIIVIIKKIGYANLTRK
jgi:hypothetical protein